MLSHRFAGFVLWLAAIGSAWAQSQDCSRTLIPATTNIHYNTISDLSIAWNMSQSDYNEAQQKFGANAVIYGVPMGASYGEFRRNIQQEAQQYQFSNFEQRSLAYATSALNDADVRVYRACIASQGGLALVDNQIGHDHYIISLEYIPFPNENSPPHGRLGATANLVPGSLADLKRDIDGRLFGRVTFQFTLTPVEPKKEVTIDVGVGDVSRSLLLPPLDVPIAKTYHWRLVRTDDCTARDISCTDGANPQDIECNGARLGFSSVCWSNGTNHDYAPFPACQGKKNWCTYKNVLTDSCKGGGHPGNMSVCVYE